MAACTRSAFPGASGALVNAKTACQTRSGCETATTTGTTTTTMPCAWKRPNSSSRRRSLTSSGLSTEGCRSCFFEVAAFKARQAEVAAANSSRITQRKAERMRTRRETISLHGNWRCPPCHSSLSAPSSSSSFSSLSFHRSPLVHTRGLLPLNTIGVIVTTTDDRRKMSFGRTNQLEKRTGSVVTVMAGRIKFSSSLAVDIPLREHPEVSFDQYILDRPRLFHAMFPDRSRSQRLDEETWRIFMLPITFIFLSARPVVDMRIWNEDASSFSVAIARRAGMVNGTAKKAAHTLCLQATRCKLEGLDFIMKPSDFILGVNGVLFADRSAGSTRLKGSVALSVDLGSIPEAISATPQPLIEGVGDLLVKQLLETMKTKVNERLLHDYKRYAREKSRTTARIGIQRT